jgi:hypothetical protein
MIFDTPALLDETLVLLTAASKCFPGNPSQSAVQRWMRRGSRGAVLETVFICGKRYTSKEAIARFLRGQLQIEAERPAPTRTMSKKDIEAAARRFGLPEPLVTRNHPPACDG